MSVYRFPGRDGLGMAYREVGRGRPIVLLHGFTTTSSLWLHSGLAAALAGRGRRVILPDLRGHGHSARRHDPSSHPPDVLVDGGLALVDWLGLDDHDLGGHSVAQPTLVATGAEDTVDGARPAAVLPGARFARVPGDHVTSLASPELATTIMSFLDDQGR